MMRLSHGATEGLPGPGAQGRQGSSSTAADEEEGLQLLTGPLSSGAAPAPAPGPDPAARDKAVLDGIYSWMQHKLAGARAAPGAGSSLGCKGGSCQVPDAPAWAAPPGLLTQGPTHDQATTAGPAWAASPGSPPPCGVAACSTSCSSATSSSFPSPRRSTSATPPSSASSASSSPPRDSPSPSSQGTTQHPPRKGAQSAKHDQPGRKLLGCFGGDPGAAASPGSSPRGGARKGVPLTGVPSDDSDYTGSMAESLPPSRHQPASRLAQYGQSQEHGATATALLAQGGMPRSIGRMYDMGGVTGSSPAAAQAALALARAGAAKRVAALEEEEMGLTLLLDDLAHQQEEQRYRHALFRLHALPRHAHNATPQHKAPPQSLALTECPWPEQRSPSSGAPAEAQLQQLMPEAQARPGEAWEQRPLDRLPRMIVLSGDALEEWAAPRQGPSRSLRLGLGPSSQYNLGVHFSGSSADCMLLYGLPGRVHLLVLADFGVVFLLFGMLFCALGGAVVSVPYWAPSPEAAVSFLALALIVRALLLFVHLMMLSLMPAPGTLEVLPTAAPKAGAPASAPLLPSPPAPAPAPAHAYAPAPAPGVVPPVVLEEVGSRESHSLDEYVALHHGARTHPPHPTAPAPAPAHAQPKTAQGGVLASPHDSADPMSGDEWLHAVCWAWLDVWVALLIIFNSFQHAMPQALPMAIWFCARGAWLELMVLLGGRHEPGGRGKHWLPSAVAVWPPILVGALLAASLPTVEPWYLALQLGLCCVADGLPLWLSTLGFQVNLSNGAAAQSVYFFQAAEEAEASGAFWLGMGRCLPLLGLALGFLKA